MKSDNQQQDLSTPIEDLMRALKVSLQQWGRAFAYVTKLRREAVVGLVDPVFSYLLKNRGLADWTRSSRASPILVLHRLHGKGCKMR